MAAVVSERSEVGGQGSGQRCICIHANDNVATVLENSEPGQVTSLGESRQGSLQITEPVARGHKIALQKLAAGEPVRKYGVVIGVAGQEIAAGQWVHTHNCLSRFDERSATLDVHSGAPTDTKYE